MHHYHFLLFSFLLIFALPSFARYNKDNFLRFQNPENKGSVVVAMYPLDSDPDQERALVSIPFNGLGETAVKHCNFISVVSINEFVLGLGGDGRAMQLEAGDIACQCFKDRAGKETIGKSFGIQTSERHLIPDNGPIETIFCSDWPGLQRWFEFRGIQPPAPHEVAAEKIAQLTDGS
ncbi:MAG: hypothetical protein L6R35_005530 [Caloplaca aegaea]|nr:MAG: hypothetical protein L6R35_005530 [Caloplaca aegaea]